IGPGHLSNPLDRLGRGYAEVEILLPQGEHAGVQPRRLQHLPDQEVQILDLPSQYQEGAPATVVEQAEGALLEEREVASDQGDRGAKLVRGKVEEARLGLFQDRQLVGQLVE